MIVYVSGYPKEYARQCMYDTTEDNLTQYNTTQYNTIQYNITQHNTI